MAQTNPPFTCKEDVYFSFSENGQSTISFNNPANIKFNYPFVFNAIAYNPKDNYIYVMKRVGDEVVRLHSDGSFRNLGTIANLEVTGPVVGSFDGNGMYYVREGGKANPTVAVINVQTMTATKMNSGDFDAKDWAYHHETNSFYGAHFGELHVFTPPNIFSKKTLIGLEPGDGQVFGSAFFSKDKKLYAVNNVTTNLYQIDVETGIAKFIIKYNADQGDATACPDAFPPYPIVYARPDTFCISAAGTVKYDVIKNDTAVFSGINKTSLQITISPKHGTVSVDTATGEITYSSSLNNIDSFYYKISSNSASPVSDIGKVYIKPYIHVTFDTIGPFCQGQVVSVLPPTSKENIIGTWEPSVINTLVSGKTTYIFTPGQSGQCVQTTRVDIEIKSTVLPNFDLKANYCQNETPEILPLTSKENIIGTWEPSVINTLASGKTTYIFTPGQSGQCVQTTRVDIEIKSTVLPKFDLKANYCQNDTPEILPLTSKENIIGTWEPSVINTLASGKTTYTFTPAQSGQCAQTSVVDIEIKPVIMPQFSIKDTFCYGIGEIILPMKSQNNIEGLWSPDKIITNVSGQLILKFNADKMKNACADHIQKNITILQPINVTPEVAKCDTSLKSYNQTFSIKGSTGTGYIITPSIGDVKMIGSDKFIISKIPPDTLLSIQVSDNSGCFVKIVPAKHICSCPNADQLPKKDTSYCKGSIIPQLAPSVQIADYQYLWSNVSGETISSNHKLTPGTPGLYTVKITNPINNCVALIQEFMVKENEIPHKPVVASDTICYGSNNGHLEVANFDSGWKILWYDQQNKFFSNDKKISTLLPGTYRVYYIDSLSGCTGETSFAMVIERNKIDLHNVTKICNSSLNHYDLKFRVEGTSAPLSFISPNNLSISLDSLDIYKISDLKNMSQIILTARDKYNCSVKDTLTPVILPNPVADAGKDFVLDCLTKKGQLNGASNLLNNVGYKWKSSAQQIISDTKNFEINAKGKYILEVTDLNTQCKNQDTVEVFISDIKATIVHQDEVCNNDKKGKIEITTLTGGFGINLITINNQATTKSVFENLNAGNYTITIKDDAGCVFSQTTTIKPGLNLSIDLSAALTIKEGESIQLNAKPNISQNEILSVNWEYQPTLSCTDCLDPIANPSDSTHYVITVTSKSGCIVQASIFIAVEQQSNLIFPNIFRPQSQGNNHRFSLFPYKSISKIKKMSIFDRWGNQVFNENNFSADDTDKFWDGTFNAAFVENGVYIYIAEIEFTSGRVQVFKGDITLLK